MASCVCTRAGALCVHMCMLVLFVGMSVLSHLYECICVHGPVSVHMC